ncbi:MAG: anti-sigma factor [Rhizobiales bacterium 65-79]|jgi:anti-sigma factor RsiW|nr:anti-sigma factor [Hyphomicrobiales bacterium]OJU00242.1 MAG: anti-sigma factor [Rhizobiales bacterium 65-79]
MREHETLPTDPDDLRLLIHAHVDGELDAATALALERRLAADPALAAEHARIAALRQSIRRLPQPEPSTEFQARIAALGASGPRMPSRAGLRRPSFEWGALAASILVTAVLASGVTRWAMLQTGPEDFAAAIANDHRRSLLAASPVDVASSDRHTVKPWLDAKLGFSPPAPDLAKEGFALIGGRIEVVGNKPMPALVYRHNEHLITLVAAPQEPGAKTQPDITNLSAAGLSLVHWSDGAFSYWAISDAERSVLDDFVRRFRAASAGG